MFMIPQLGKMIRRAALLTQVAATLVVFLIFLVFTFISWQNSKSTLNLQKDQIADERSIMAQEALVTRLRTSAVLTRAGAGLFDASEAVTRDEWDNFYRKFNVPERFSDVSAVGYAPIVQENEIAALEASMRENGVEDFTVAPKTDGINVPIMYLQRYLPVTNMLGFNMYADEDRREAMELARDSGQPTVTNVVRFRGSDKEGVLLYMPVYTRNTPIDTVAERRDAIRGYIFTSLRSEQLLNDLLSTENSKGIGLVVTDDIGTNSEVVATTINEDEQRELTRSRITEVDLYGQQWQVHVYAGDDIVPDADNRRPITVLLGGLIISLIAAAAVYLLIQYRTRTFALSEEYKLQQAKDELLSLASHQLRTPATGVKQYVGMVLEGFGGKVPKAQAELLEHAYQSNERQLQIINEFLYVAKLGSGSLRTTVHKFDLAAIVRDVVDEMHGEIHRNQHTVTLDVPKKVIAEADEHSVRMIAENLVSNAVKYTPRGGSIAVTVKRLQYEIQVVVADSGIGISKKEMNLLFKQFSRVPSSMSGEVEGTGIGLYLSQQLAMRNGGVITVTSEKGKGSEFTLHLPKKSVKKVTKTKK